jgi:hypothetical protein
MAPGKEFYLASLPGMLHSQRQEGRLDFSSRKEQEDSSFSEEKEAKRLLFLRWLCVIGS